MVIPLLQEYQIHGETKQYCPRHQEDTAYVGIKRLHAITAKGLILLVDRIHEAICKGDVTEVDNQQEDGVRYIDRIAECLVVQSLRR